MQRGRARRAHPGPGAPRPLREIRRVPLLCVARERPDPGRMAPGAARRTRCSRKAGATSAASSTPTAGASRPTAARPAGAAARVGGARRPFLLRRRRAGRGDHGARPRAPRDGRPGRPANTHPFVHGRFTLVHNGTVPYFAEIRPRLLDAMTAEHRAAIQGGTDSEHLLHLILSIQSRRGGSLFASLEAALRQVIALCREIGQEPHLGLNVLLTDGVRMVGSRWRRAALSGADRDRPSSGRAYRLRLSAITARWSSPRSRPTAGLGRRSRSARCSRSPRICACASRPCRGLRRRLCSGRRRLARNGPRLLGTAPADLLDRA